ncbi:MAG: hypothetical protein ACO1RX_11555 [Candidatus Sericytochromatia bacterium]
MIKQGHTPSLSPQQRQGLYAGEIWQLPASAASLAVVARAWSTLCEELGTQPQQAQQHWEAEALRTRLGHCREALQQDAVLRQAYAELLLELGLPPAKCRVDLPRLRGIVPGLEGLPAAAPVFYAHRDTWYANPPAQINLWLPLHDCPAAQTFVFWPEAFAQSIANDSAQFDYAKWSQTTGFQAQTHSAESIYPRALTRPPGPAVGFACKRGQPLLFAAAQLHATLPNPGPGLRFSLDLRCVYTPDQRAGLRALDPDNASHGSTLDTYDWLGAGHD